MSAREQERIAAIVVAAGSSRRMGGQDKLWLPIAGLPLLGHSLAALGRLPEIGQIMVVTMAESIERLKQLRARPPWDAVTGLVAGGAERPDSVYAGLQALDPCDLVLIHDGARPCLSAALIRAGIAAARACGAAVPALPVADTIKLVDAQDRVLSTPQRSTLRAIQTPQVFRYELLRRAYEQAGAARATCTDDAMLIERLGLPVATFPGDPRNIKVSTPADLPLVRLLLEDVGQGLSAES